MNSKLPSLPSALIRLALQDLRKCEAMPEVYRINMCDWLYRSSDGLCHACLAGAVMAQSLKCPLPRNQAAAPGSMKSWGKDDKDRLRALDAFRRGMIYEGLQCLKKPFPPEVESRYPIPDYEDDPTQFHADMEALAKTLEEHGL